MTVRGKNISITLGHTEDAKRQAATALYGYNVEKTGIDDRTPVGAELRGSSGEVLGGLWGRTELGLLFLDMFFLPQHLRGESYGAQLLLAVEEEAIRRGCKHPVVETSSFQAPMFYIEHGYEELGRVPFGIEGHARIFLRKDFSMSLVGSG
jgi:GNAT superfamily N-acetyltransferase